MSVTREASRSEREVEMIHSAVYAIFKALSLGPINGALSLLFSASHSSKKKYTLSDMNYIYISPDWRDQQLLQLLW